MTVVPLRDGTRVVLRDLRPDDRERLQRGFDALSPAARLMRFGHEIDELTPSMLDELMDVDGTDHVAIVALAEDDPDGPGLGIARFIREPYDTHAAEAAVTVAEGQRGRGIGTILLSALGARAVQEGITEFRNYVLAENREMQSVFEALGARTTIAGGPVVRMDLPLDGILHPDSAAATLLRALAAEDPAPPS
jgi:GNAT superfamily N-acetyltransferase